MRFLKCHLLGFESDVPAPSNSTATCFKSGCLTKEHNLLQCNRTSSTYFSLKQSLKNHNKRFLQESNDEPTKKYRPSMFVTAFLFTCKLEFRTTCQESCAFMSNLNRGEEILECDEFNNVHVKLALREETGSGNILGKLSFRPAVCKQKPPSFFLSNPGDILVN